MVAPFPDPRAPISGACTGTAVTALSYSPGFGDLSGLDSTWGTSGGRLAFTYGYDLAGRISTIAETVNSTTTTRTYHYDARGRLEAVTTPGPTTQYAYGYDANGNRTSWTSPSGSCSTSCTEFDAQDRLLRYGTTVFTYDAAGNLASRDLDGNPGTPADRTTYAYDELGHLRRVDLPGGAVRRYLIDGLGRRVGRYVGTATTATADRFWLYQDGLNPVAQLHNAGNLELLFVYGTMPHVPDAVVQVGTNTVFRVVTDHLGSVRRLVNVDDGSVAASYDYGPFGELQTSAPTVGSLAERFPFRFAGGLWDQDTGLIRFGARDYDPRLGRWTAKDPILWDGGQANLYEYAHSSPVEFLDVTGRSPLLRGLAVGLALGAGSDAGGEANGDPAVVFLGLFIEAWIVPYVARGLSILGGLLASRVRPCRAGASSAAVDRVVAASGGHIKQAIDAANKAGLNQMETVEAITRVIKTTGRDIGPIVDMGGAKIIPPIVNGVGVPIVHVSPSGVATLGSATVETGVGSGGVVTTITNIVLP